MDEKKHRENWESYLYPDGRTLVNLFDIRDIDKLHEAERLATRERTSTLDLSIDLKSLSVEHFKNLHQHLFQDVYAWAGDLRVVNMKKGGMVFEDYRYLEKGLNDLVNEIKNADLRQMSTDEFVEHGHKWFMQANFLHPFREGNGRVQRIFITQLANHIGIELNFDYISQARMSNACNMAHGLSDSRALKKLFVDASDPYRKSMLSDFFEFVSASPEPDFFDIVSIETVDASKHYKGVLSWVGYNAFAIMDKDNDVFLADISILPQNAALGESIEFDVPSDYYANKSVSLTQKDFLLESIVTHLNATEDLRKLALTSQSTSHTNENLHLQKNTVNKTLDDLYVAQYEIKRLKNDCPLKPIYLQVLKDNLATLNKIQEQGAFRNASRQLRAITTNLSAMLSPQLSETPRNAQTRRNSPSL